MVRKYYLDSNILLAVSAGPGKEPNQFRMSMGVLDQIRRGETIGVVSSLTLMEVITVLRVKKGREKSSLDSMRPDQQSEFVLRESKSMYDKLVTELMKLPNLKFEYGRRADVYSVMRDALAILHEIRGKVRPDGNSRFGGAGTVDVIHALLAKDMGCDELVTFDTGFEEMGGIDALESLKFRVLKW
ncbi:MAG: type II toxin-antitoxin system VapC family toxin [Nitrosopumilaceae archaeon]|nr:type II toxin-antitoxin system VapC family toxin [Nitrosopumilaceae archaeon]